jgi:hypothetical protein
MNTKSSGAAETEDGTQPLSAPAVTDSVPALTTTSGSESSGPQFKSARLQQLLGAKLGTSAKPESSMLKSSDALNAENANKLLTNGDSVSEMTAEDIVSSADDVANGGNTNTVNTGNAVSNSNGLDYVNNGSVNENQPESTVHVNAWETCDTSQITLIESKS